MDAEILEHLERILSERLELVADRKFYERDPQGHLARLEKLSAELMAVRLPPSVPPVLRHYLERQSYVKALEWLREQRSA